MRDVLESKNSFPSADYQIVSIDTTLNFKIHNQIKDNEMADRLMRFLSIWGDGKPDQYTKNDVIYISSIRKDILEEFGFPVISLSETDAPRETYEQGNHPIAQTAVNSQTADYAVAVSTEKQKRITDANSVLAKWVSGQTIDISSTGGVSGLLRSACKNMGDFLLDAINWQAEGVSADDYQKLKKGNLICLERQAKGNGLYVVPATWDSIIIIMAFARFSEYGGQSWNYSEADFDVFLVTSWVSKVKKDFINAVTAKQSGENASYIEAAIAAEIYRMVLYGEYREKKLSNLTIRTLYEAKGLTSRENSHTQEWKSLVSVIGQKGADEINRETVRQYYNIVQGGGGNIIVLDDLHFSNTLRRVKTLKLQLEIDDAIANEPIKLRRDVFIHLKDIYDRVDKVAKAEVDGARAFIHSIYEYFESEEIEDDDILDLTSAAKDFYSEIDSTRINIATPSIIDSVRKASKQIAKSIQDIGAVLDEDDTLTVLMAFSGDPLTQVKPLVDLLVQLGKDIEKVEKAIASKESELGSESDPISLDGRYTEELKTIEEDIETLNVLR